MPSSDNGILCIGGPWGGQEHAWDDDIEIRKQYYQYKSEWNRRTFVWIWKDLLNA